jgi:hypothetical protein
MRLLSSPVEQVLLVDAVWCFMLSAYYGSAHGLCGPCACLITAANLRPAFSTERPPLTHPLSQNEFAKAR